MKLADFLKYVCFNVDIWSRIKLRGQSNVSSLLPSLFCSVKTRSCWHRKHQPWIFIMSEIVLKTNGECRRGRKIESSEQINFHKLFHFLTPSAHYTNEGKRQTQECVNYFLFFTSDKNKYYSFSARIISPLGTSTRLVSAILILLDCWTAYIVPCIVLQWKNGANEWKEEKKRNKSLNWNNRKRLWNEIKISSALASNGNEAFRFFTTDFNM